MPANLSTLSSSQQSEGKSNRQKFTSLFPFITAALLMLNTTTVWAHQFNLVFVAPLSGENAEEGSQAMAAFIYATGEEDSHPMEESDGHLGGLDSYVYPLDSTLSSSILVQKLNEIIDKEHPTFITGVFSTDTEALLRDAITGKAVVLVNPEHSLRWKTKQNTLNLLTNLSGEPLAKVLQRNSLTLAKPAAYRAYIAARLIAVSVRSLTDNPADNIHATNAAMDKALALP
jgi:hypothetical protein